MIQKDPHPFNASQAGSLWEGGYHQIKPRLPGVLDKGVPATKRGLGGVPKSAP